MTLDDGFDDIDNWLVYLDQKKPERQSMVLYDSKLDTRVLTSKCHGTVDNIVADEG